MQAVIWVEALITKQARYPYTAPPSQTPPPPPPPPPTPPTPLPNSIIEATGGAKNLHEKIPPGRSQRIFFNEGQLT